MSESLTHIVEGAVGKEGIIIDCVAGGEIALWAPVTLAAAGTGEDLPRVTTTTTAADRKVLGVAVGPKRASGKAADAAGDLVKVQVFGRAKVKVDGTTAIAIGDGLVTKNAAGVAVKASALDAPSSYAEATVQAELDKLDAIFAVAWKASTADGDIIPCWILGPTPKFS